MGDDVNLAARLMARAPMGKVWISGRVHRRIKSVFETIDLPPLQMRGKRQPVHAFEVVRTAVPQVTFEIEADMPFVGHDMLLLTLDKELRQARTGRRRAIALVGDAGVGKTRIARQIVGMAADAGFRVAWFTCLSRSGRKSTWAALVSQLLDLPLGRPGEPVPMTIRKQLRAKLEALELADLETSLADLLFGAGSAGADGPAQSANSDAAQQEQIADLFLRFSQMSLEEMKRSGVFGAARRRIQDALEDQVGDRSSVFGQAEARTNLNKALVRFLAQYTAQTPVLVVIDDLHLENLQALETLKAVVEGADAGKLAIVLAFEPILLDFELQVFPIPDLTRDETALIAKTILRVTELEPRLSEFLWERTHGRPLFIESLLRALLEGEYVTLEQGRAQLNTHANPETLPEDIRELVTSRLDRLPAEAQTILAAAAVLAEDFSVEALQALTEIEDQDRLLGVLHDLTRAQILDRHETGRSSFRHGMTQRVLYESLSRAQRLKLHRVAAAYWRRQPAADSQPIMLAHHLVKCGLLPEAIEIVMGAAEAAEAKPDIDQAVEYYSYALSLLPDDKHILLQLQRLKTPGSPV
jgi:predicted ATPase